MTFFRWPGKIQFSKFFYQILYIIRRHQKLPKYKFLWKKLKNWIFPGQKTAHQKLTFSSLSLKNSLFLDGQEKSNFQNFSTKFCRSLEDVINYLNINFYENISKIGFFLAKKRRANSHFRHCTCIKKLCMWIWADDAQIHFPSIGYFNRNHIYLSLAYSLFN